MGFMKFTHFLTCYVFVCKTVDLGCSFQGQILMGFRVILLGVLEFGVSKLVGVTYKLPCYLEVTWVVPSFFCF